MELNSSLARISLFRNGCILLRFCFFDIFRSAPGVLLPPNIGSNKPRKSYHAVLDMQYLKYQLALYAIFDIHWLKLDSSLLHYRISRVESEIENRIEKNRNRFEPS